MKMHQQFTLQGRYPYDIGVKGDSLPSTDIVYKQDSKLFVLRDKPITQQDALPKANPRNPIYELDPEIERTRRELRQRARELMAHRGNNDQNLIEEQDPQRKNPPAPSGLNPTVTIPKFEAEHFELKSVMLNMLNTLGQFSRSLAENARQHLKSFLEICNSFKIHGVCNDLETKAISLFTEG
ncbi:hypothetical protein V6N12_049276 [Hibiscus sabdariffa]|uniref:Uncharacterized protein n=1 Tax=Hibiscus sabdariffa TaxID=183260 RepID=A0ABR2EJQ8_9ROSI